MKEKHKFSVVIPVYNEEGILRESIEALVKNVSAITEFDLEYEIIICENGSYDNTHQIAKQLTEELPAIRVEHLKYPSYGEAMKLGISAAVHEKIIIFNIDFWDMEFLKKTMVLLDEYDCIVGSKVIEGAVDGRPLLRRLITKGFNLFLRLIYGFKGTDTHGIKGFRRSSIYPVSMQCLTDREIFDTELLLRADRAKLLIYELPVTIQEIRMPRLKLLRRIPSTARDLFRLYIALQFKPVITLNAPRYEQQSLKDISLLKTYQKIKILGDRLTPNEISFVTEIPLATVRELQEIMRMESDRNE
ncbi:MAG: glycosyltransferase family 2 protein [Nitrospirae bacterium]|nr:glycosyltransferase family 2 protein [Nitrospirota bacterium]MCL5976701.1 glycosyltransferase family 2 protein [Nitrospirota bacterium]